MNCLVSPLILTCVIAQFATNNIDVNVTSSTNDVSGSAMAYSYPTQTITVSGLNSGTTYRYCVIATDRTSTDVQIGKTAAVCGSFTTRILNSDKSDGMYVYIHS